MIAKLIAEIRRKGAPIVVGLDPMLSYIPSKVVDAKIKDMGETLDAAAASIVSNAVQAITCIILGNALIAVLSRVRFINRMTTGEQ